MKSLLYLLTALLLFGVLYTHFTTYKAYAHSQGHHHKPKPKPKPKPRPAACKDLENQLDACTDDLNTCNDDLAFCESQPSQVVPGDGYANPDAFGVSGHGPALSYTDNGDGTFADNSSGLMWEKKDEAGGIHDKGNSYSWTDTGDGDNTNPDGTLFTVFLDALNNSCNGDGLDSCATDADCAGIGDGVCGLAGYQDWRIPNIKEVTGIVDYAKDNPASGVPGSTDAVLYWSATTGSGVNTDSAWVVHFFDGSNGITGKDSTLGARAVRP